MAPPSKGVAPLRKARTIINDGTMPGAAASDRPAVSAAGVDGVLRLSNGLSDGPWQPLNHSIYSLFFYLRFLNYFCLIKVKGKSRVSQLHILIIFLSSFSQLLLSY